MPWYSDAVAALKDAIRLSGGQTHFARVCGCTQGNISQLVVRGSALPERFVLKAEAATGISRHRFRPDIYPHPVARLVIDIAANQEGVVCDPHPISQPSNDA